MLAWPRHPARSLTHCGQELIPPSCWYLPLGLWPETAHRRWRKSVYQQLCFLFSCLFWERERERLVLSPCSAQLLAHEGPLSTSTKIFKVFAIIINIIIIMWPLYFKKQEQKKLDTVSLCALNLPNGFEDRSQINMPFTISQKVCYYQ